jgi:hypothetical protein
MINKTIIKELKKKKSQPRIYSMINKIRKDSGYRITKEEAACLLAGQLGIDISKIISKDELEKIKNLEPMTPIQIQTKGNKVSKIININLGTFSINEPLLPKKIIDEAQKMANEVYPRFYIFENSARNLILKIMENKYGDKWWDSKVSNDIKKRVEDRLKNEKNNNWHSKRNVHKIFYTDFGDLKSIIINNWDDFKNIFPRQDWITSRFSDLEPSRNTIAHNNPLQTDDIKRIETYFKDWIKQIKSVTSVTGDKNE